MVFWETSTGDNCERIGHGQQNYEQRQGLSLPIGHVKGEGGEARGVEGAYGERESAASEEPAERHATVGRGSSCLFLKLLI